MSLKNIYEQTKKISSKAIYIVVALSTTGILVGTDIGMGTASAAQLQTRSMAVSSSALGNVSTDVNGTAVAAGGGGNGVKTKETFTFNLATTSHLQTILIEECTTPIPGTTCTSPTGFTAANVASVASQSGWTAGTWAIDTSTVLTGAPYNCTGSSPGRTNCIAVSRTDPSTTEASGTTVTLAFGGGTSDYITNPTTTGTWFARIITYSDTAYATQVDYGSVASSTATQINVTAKVQETLNFSVGSTVTAPGAGCTAYTDSGGLTLGDVNGALGTGLTYFNHSYFRISTNDLHGAVVDYSGGLPTSGTNTIAGIGTTATASTTGTPQFGIGIDASDTESGSGYSFTTLAATAPYSTANGGGGTQAGSSGSLGGTYAYNTASMTSPIQIASSSSPITCDTGSVMYMANISNLTPSGVYQTTVSYIAIPTY
jgi:hypothetical protein